QVLGGRNQHAFLHQAGCVAHPGHVAAASLDAEIVQVHPPKHDPRTGRGGQHAQVHRGAAVQPYSVAFHGVANCLFLWQSPPRYLFSDEQITALVAGLSVAKKPHFVALVGQVPSASSAIETGAENITYPGRPPALYVAIVNLTILNPPLRVVSCCYGRGILLAPR